MFADAARSFLRVCTSGVFDRNSEASFCITLCRQRGYGHSPCWQSTVFDITFHFENLLLGLCIRLVLYQLGGLSRTDMVFFASYGNDRYSAVKNFYSKISCGVEVFVV
jgi:hypothetical protein